MVGKVLPTTLQLHTAYLLRSLLIETPDRWRKALFDPEAHTITARYLLFTDGSFNDSHATGGGGFFIMDRHTNTTYRGGSHLHPIFDPLDSEYDGMILGLLYLLKLAPGSVLILPNSSTLLHIIRRPHRLFRPIDECVSRILDLINDLLTARSFLRPLVTIVYGGYNVGQDSVDACFPSRFELAY